jgi:hypothetical protein
MMEGPVKLAISCVAALSLAGCLDDPTTGGGYLEGMRPAKPSLDNPNNSPLPVNPEIFEGMNKASSIEMPELDTNVIVETISPPVPMDEVCDNCQVIAFHIHHSDSLDEIRVFSDGGNFLCKIFLNDKGSVVDDCGWTRQ